MSNIEEIEKIAQKEVYPSRYYGRVFPGTWPSNLHRQVCIRLATEIYETRAAQLQQKLAEEEKESVADELE